MRSCPQCPRVFVVRRVFRVRNTAERGAGALVSKAAVSRAVTTEIKAGALVRKDAVRTETKVCGFVETCHGGGAQAVRKQHGGGREY